MTGRKDPCVAIELTLYHHLVVGNVSYLARVDLHNCLVTCRNCAYFYIVLRHRSQIGRRYTQDTSIYLVDWVRYLSWTLGGSEFISELYIKRL